MPTPPRVVLTLLLLLAAPLLAQNVDGRLDVSFLQEGWAQPSLSFGGSPAPEQLLYDAAVDAAGRVVAVGTLRNPANPADYDCALVRTTRDGRRWDSSFGPLGQRRITLNRGGANTETCTALLALPDGSLIVTGYASTAGDRLSGVVVKLDANGVPDAGFFDNGVFEANAQLGWTAPNESSVLRDVIVDAQGRLLATGYHFVDAQRRGVVLRFTTDGSLDTAFATGGAAVLEDTASVTALMSALDSSGAILVAGLAELPPAPRSAVVFRLDDSGQPDRDFGDGMDMPGAQGGNGRGFVPRCNRIGSFLVDAADRLIFSCEPDPSGATPGPILASGVLRLAPDGQPDTGFSSDGFLELLPFGTPLGVIETPARLALQADGKLLVAATTSFASHPDNPSDIFVTRINEDASYDDIGYFSGYSLFRLENPFAATDSSRESVNGLALDPLGRPLIAGSRTAGGVLRSLLLRLGMPDPLESRGFIDASFGGGKGFITQKFSTTPGNRDSTTAYALSQDDSGRNLVAGRLRFDTDPSPTYLCGLFRTLPDGTGFDTSFAPPNGFRTLGLDPNGANGFLCSAVLAMPDGSSLIAGGVGSNGTVIRLRADGSVDTSYFGNGALETGPELGFAAQGRSAVFYGMAHDRQGRVLVVGQTQQTVAGESENGGIVLRLRADGSIDTSFGANGYRLLVTATNPRRLFLSSVAPMSDGSLVVAGLEGSSVQGNRGSVVYKLRDDGSDDSTWPGGGYQRLAGTCLGTYHLALDAQDRVLLHCQRSDSPGDLGILRLLPNGQPDINFGNAGIGRVQFGPPGSPADSATELSAFLPTADGKLIVVGTHRNSAADDALHGTTDIGVARLRDDGSPDSETFGRYNGASLLRLPVPGGRFQDFPDAALLQPDGKVLIAATRGDQRPGVPSANSTEVVLLRVTADAQAVVDERLFSDGFDGSGTGAD
ncbi:delta-60 repeat domain-containing protein [Tahibacter harae]|uniref:Delta-60 repeat protein n=1 Tax=Tahibacter harae TaxID=2963937 RepID=A0ABT1QYL8_9GAMM|nr:delta-60 repeat domain-containing protein [Tahibacter harae]MCQ4167382.1 hypothetical protein [Tahibacter harae]